MANKLIKLALSPDINFHLIAIASHQSDYKVCWGVNNLLGTHLTADNDITIIDKKTSTVQNYSLHSYFDEESLIQYNLLSNRSETGILIKEYNNFDYFLKLSKEANSDEIDEIIAKIKSIDFVIMCIYIPTNSIKDINKFIF